MHINCWANSTSVLQLADRPTSSVLIMARHSTTRDSRESFPQLQGPVFMKRPSQASIDNLCNPRLPAHYLHAGLKMNPQICKKTRRMIRDLALRHLDFSIPYLEQPQSQIDFFKREVLLEVELSHLIRYQDAWVVEVFLRIVYQRPGNMRNFQELDSELQITQHDRPCQRQSNVHSKNLAIQLEDVQYNRPRQMSLAVCYNSQVTHPEDAQHELVCSDNQAKDDQVNTVQDGCPSNTTSCLALLSALLASMPGLHRFHAVITEAGLSTDDHLLHFFRMTSTGREKFITQALMETSTLFERVVILEIMYFEFAIS